VIQRRNGPRFALKTISKLLRRDFYRDVPSQPRIARFPNLSHAAFADARNDFIGAEF
jgi:hypothetical protein